MVDEPVADTASNGGGAWNGHGASNPAHESLGDAGAVGFALTAALELARADLAKAVEARENALAWVRELEAAVRERDSVIAELRRALLDRDQRVDELAERLERTLVRITEVEHSLERTTELQRSLEAEFDQARRAQDRAASALAATRDVSDRSRTEIAERDALIRQLQAEVVRRGAPGSRAALGTALADLFRAAKQRRAERLAATEPWRLPPGKRH